MLLLIFNERIIYHDTKVLHKDAGLFYHRHHWLTLLITTFSHICISPETNNNNINPFFFTPYTQPPTTVQYVFIWCVCVAKYQTHTSFVFVTMECVSILCVFLINYCRLSWLKLMFSFDILGAIVIIIIDRDWPKPVNRPSIKDYESNNQVHCVRMCISQSKCTPFGIYNSW